MLPIKRAMRFRVWDKTNKRFLEKTESFLIDLVSHEGGTVLEYKPDDQANFVIQQSTEMKTEEGTEIFEGDIIEFIWSGVKNLAQVKYKFGSYIAELIESEGALDFHWFHALVRFDCPIKIVGNILENPEFLQTKTT